MRTAAAPATPGPFPAPSGRLGVTGTPAFLFLGPESVEVSPGALDASRMAELIASVE